MIHSLPVAPAADPCFTLVRRPAPRLRAHVLSYSGFRTRSPIGHRILPCNVPVLIIDITGAGRVLTGPSATAAISEEVRWGHGVTIGLTPLGVRALLGMPMSALTGAAVPLGPDLPDPRSLGPEFPGPEFPGPDFPGPDFPGPDFPGPDFPGPDLLGPDFLELAERLAAVSSWLDRFTFLDSWLTRRLNPDATSDPLVTAAWFGLQRPGAPRVATVAAELGVSRRRLETGFQRFIGLSPGAVARVARFQRAVSMVAVGAALHRAAADSGYADQPHFTREVRAMAGVTPTELRKVLRAALPEPPQTSRPPVARRF
jgi:AraC-like DNA-binding protein